MKRLAILFLAALSLGACAAKKSYFYVFDYGSRQDVVNETRAKNMTVEPGLVRSARVSARTPAKAKEQYLEEAIRGLEQQIKDAERSARNPSSDSGEGHRARVAVLLAERVRLAEALRDLEACKHVAAAHVDGGVRDGRSVPRPLPLQDSRAMGVPESAPVSTGYQRADERPAGAGAQALADAIEDALTRGHWSQERLDGFRGSARSIEGSPVASAWKVKAFLLLGLYAWYLDEHDEAGRAFVTAKRLGATDCRSVVCEYWTPGAVLAFKQAS